MEIDPSLLQKECPINQIMSNTIQVFIYKKGLPANKKSKIKKKILYNRTNHPRMNSLWVIYNIYNCKRIPFKNMLLESSLLTTENGIKGRQERKRKIKKGGLILWTLYDSVATHVVK
jgi:hypothetical protein